MKLKLLLVEDSPMIIRGLQYTLEQAGYEVVVCMSKRMADDRLQKMQFDIAILDVNLPDGSGFDLCKQLKDETDIPVIFLTARDEESDVVMGLELGADDYITKPFEGKELVARVKAVLRRASPGESEKDTLSFPGLTISLEKYEVHYQGKLLEMPPKELEVLYFLAAHQNRVFTREQLLEQVWGFDFFGDSRTVDVHIKRLREKLQDSEALGWTIRTVWGVGYKFEVK